MGAGDAGVIRADAEATMGRGELESIYDQRRYLIPFRTGLLPQIFCDTLVLGSGVAGLRAAVAAAEGGDVIVCAKDAVGLTNTSKAQGGIAGVLRDDDSVEAHIRDTMIAGAGLCDEPAVRLVCTDGPGRLEELIEWGMDFDRTELGSLMVGREGGHTASRVYHAGGDATGLELQRCLEKRVGDESAIRVFDHCFVIDLLTASERVGAAVVGAITWHTRYGLQVIWARTTILAMGGAGQVYRETSNPRVATADGLSIAHRAGATLQDMAFVQFHPTTLYVPGAARALISEAVRGEGAHLLDHAGKRFMDSVHELAELAPRDVVSRAIVEQIAMQGGKHVWLDCRHIERFAQRFPGITSTLESFGLDPRVDLIPVHPAAHYTIGGVRTDLNGWTDLGNLMAVGEVSCTGLHGANRLASNSLLEGLVMGAIAGEQAAGRVGDHPVTPATVVSNIDVSSRAELDLGDVRSSLQSAMWINAGIERAGSKLSDAMDMFDFWGRYTLDKVFESPEGWEVQNMLTAGWLIVRSALARTESRGAHWRTTNTQPDEHARHSLWKRGRDAPVFEAVDTGGQQDGSQGNPSVGAGVEGV